MAHFRGTIRGHRGEASRLSTARAGLHVTAFGWQGGVIVELWEKDGRDWAQVRLTYHPHGGNGPVVILYEGPVDAVGRSNLAAMRIAGDTPAQSDLACLSNIDTLDG